MRSRLQSIRPTRRIRERLALNRAFSQWSPLSEFFEQFQQGVSIPIAVDTVAWNKRRGNQKNPRFDVESAILFGYISLATASWILDELREPFDLASSKLSRVVGSADKSNDVVTCLSIDRSRRVSQVVSWFWMSMNMDSATVLHRYLRLPVTLRSIFQPPVHHAIRLGWERRSPSCKKAFDF